ASQVYGEMTKEFEAVYPINSDSDAVAAYLGSLRDVTFTLGMRTWARMTVTTGRSKAYLYFFSHAPPAAANAHLGAYHAAEIVYVFNNLSHVNRPYQTVDFQLGDTMSSYWVNFASTGDPNGGGLPKWTAYDVGSETYMEFGDTVKSGNHLLKPQLDFLEQFF